MAVYVKFTYVESANLSSVPIVTGQIIALTDTGGYYYDWNGARYLVNAPEGTDALGVGEIDSSSTAASLIATVPDVVELRDGLCVYLINTQQSFGDAPASLDVNSLGSKYIYNSSTGTRQFTYPVNSGSMFIYNSTRVPGGCWDIVSAISPTNTAIGNVHAVCENVPMAGVFTAVTTQTGFNLTDGALISVKFTSGAPADTSLCITDGTTTTPAFPIIYEGDALVDGLVTPGSTALFRYHVLALSGRDQGQFQLLSVDSIVDSVRQLENEFYRSSLFWCTFGETTYNEITAAIQRKVLCAVYYQDSLYLLSDIRRSKYFFSCVDGATSRRMSCSAAGDIWEEDDAIALATEAQVNEKYTMPPEGIPATDLAFTPAVVDPTFQVADAAAASKLTGQRFDQLESIVNYNLYTVVHEDTINFEETGMDPDTGWDDETDNEYMSYPNPFAETLLFTLGSPIYEWCIWAYTEENKFREGHHPAVVTGFVNTTCPLLLPYVSGDAYYKIGFHRADMEPISPSEIDWVQGAISVCSYSAEAESVCKCTTRNDLMLVDQFTAIATTYYNGRSDMRSDRSLNMQYGDNTVLDTTSDTNQIDSATFVGLVLRGIPYAESPYYTYNYGDSIVANPNYAWAYNPQYYQYKVTPVTNPRPVRTASQIAEWLVNQSRMVPIDASFVNIQPGDIIFYARKDSQGDWLSPNTYMNIDTVGICISSEPAEAARAQFPYSHTVLFVTEAGADTPCFATVVAEDEDTVTPSQSINRHTLCLVCRPDLGTLSGTVSTATKVLPANPLSTGTPGQMMYDASTLYICVAPNTWKSVSLT